MLNKPAGISSNTAANIVKKLTGAKKAGHLGTLDVLGDGVLPITLGKSTRLFDFFLKKRKTYRAVFAFGFETSTLDAEGEITNVNLKEVSKQQIENELPNFIGKIKQLPPQFSALKVNGKVAYDLARKGEKIDLKEREVEIFSFKLIGKPSTEKLNELKERFLEFHSEKEFEEKKLEKVFENQLYEFEIECSAGTYIRSLCRDLSHNTASCGAMLCITRTKCGKFDIKNSFTLDEIKNGKYELLSSFDVVDLPVLSLLGEEGKEILDGKSVFKLPVLRGQFKLVCGNRFFGIANNFDNGKIKVETFLLEE